MKIRCDYCGNYMEPTDKVCPNCSGVNNDTVNTESKTPKTIHELKIYCKVKNLPLKGMHIHIDEDYKAPKAYGIYFDGKNYIVYKNKSDGSRSVRYEGTDEEYAVKEMYLKIRDLMIEGGLK